MEKLTIIIMTVVVFVFMLVSNAIAAPADKNNNNESLNRNILFYDNFANSTESENNWQVGADSHVDYSISDGSLNFHQDKDWGFLVLTDEVIEDINDKFEWQDYEVEIQIRGESVFTGFVLRFDGFNNAYVIIIDSKGNLYPWILESGEWTELPTADGGNLDLNDGNLHTLTAQIYTDEDNKANIVIMYNNSPHYIWTDDVPGRICSGYPGIYVQTWGTTKAYFEVDQFSMSTLIDQHHRILTQLEFRDNMYERLFYVDYWTPEERKNQIQEFKNVLSEADLPESSPRLFFSKEQLPEIHKKLNSESVEQIVSRAQTRANRHINNVNPDDLVGSVAPGLSKDAVAPVFGRRISGILEDLSFMWLAKNDQRYAEHGLKILEALVNDFCSDSNFIKEATYVPHAMGELVYGFAIAYDWLNCVMDEQLKVDAGRVLAGFVKTMGDHIHSEGSWWMPYHNWTGIVSGSMGLAALAIEGEVEDFDVYPYIWMAYDTISLYLGKGYDPKGCNFEGNMYMQLALRGAVPFIESLKLRGGPNLFEKESLSNVINYWVDDIVPGKDFLNALSQSGYAGIDFDYLPIKLAVEYDNPLGLWLWDELGTGNWAITALWYPENMQAEGPQDSEQPLVNYYKTRGLVNFRTGWSKDDLFFSFTSSPFRSITHDRSDENHFTLYAYGNMFAIDLGYNVFDSENHNVILINGEGQAPAGRSRGVDGQIVSFTDSSSYGFALGDAKSAYDRNWQGTLGSPVSVADRYVLYVKGDHMTDDPGKNPFPYFVIFDDIQSSVYTDAQYTWLLHSEAGISFEHNPEIKKEDSLDKRGENVFHAISAKTSDRMELVFLNPNEIEHEIDIVYSHSGLNIHAEAANPQFLTVLLPIKSDWESSLPDIKRLKGQGYSGGLLLWKEMCDLILINKGGDNISVEEIHTDAKFTHVRYDLSGNIISWVVYGATTLEISNQDKFDDLEKPQNYIFDGVKVDSFN